LIRPSAALLKLIPRGSRPGGTHFAPADDRTVGVFSLGGLFVVLVIDLGEFRVDHVFLLAVGACRTLAGVGRLSAFRLLVHGFAELHGSLRQRVGLGLDRARVIALERFFEIRHGILDGTAFAFADFRAMLGERLFGGMHQRFAMVLGFYCGLSLLVLLGVRLGVLDHLFDVAFGQATRRLDADLLFLASRLVLGGDVDDAVGVDVEGDLDLRHAARRRGYSD